MNILIQYAILTNPGPEFNNSQKCQVVLVATRKKIKYQAIKILSANVANKLKQLFLQRCYRYYFFWIICFLLHSPFFSVDEGAILDAVFEKFSYPPPTGFERIMIEKTVL